MSLFTFSCLPEVRCINISRFFECKSRNINNNNNNNKSIFIPKNYLQDGNDITWKDTVEFTFPVQGGRVIKVYDGDTITIASKIFNQDSVLYRFSVRLNGIDAPEIKGKDEDEKLAAKKSRDALSELILNKYVRLKNIKNEKYGRILADVYLDDLNICEWLLKNRYAIEYDGGTKKVPKSWISYQITGDFL